MSKIKEKKFNSIKSEMEEIKKFIVSNNDSDNSEQNKIDYPVSFNGKMRFKITLPATNSQKEIEAAVMQHEKTKHYLSNKSPKKIIIIPQRIVNIVF